MKTFIKHFLNQLSKISSNLNINNIALFISIIKKCKKKKGRIFFLGVGGALEMHLTLSMILEK
jgi:hypothetical protein